MLKENIQEHFKCDSNFAGRNCGWIEVEYINELDEVDEQTQLDDIKYYYQIAKDLEALENKVAIYITEAHKDYIKYISSDDYVHDIVSDHILDDEVIACVYKVQINKLTSKLK